MMYMDVKVPTALYLHSYWSVFCLQRSTLETFTGYSGWGSLWLILWLRVRFRSCTVLVWVRVRVIPPCTVWVPYITVWLHHVGSPELPEYV